MNTHSNDLVLRTTDTLDALDIPYMLVGSFSSNAYGVARSTQDADFVIELAGKSVVPLVAALAPELVVDPPLSFESVTMTSRFNAKHAATGFKIEFFFSKRRRIRPIAIATTMPTTVSRSTRLAADAGGRDHPETSLARSRKTRQRFRRRKKRSCGKNESVEHSVHSPVV